MHRTISVLTWGKDTKNSVSRISVLRLIKLSVRFYQSQNYHLQFSRSPRPTSCWDWIYLSLSNRILNMAGYLGSLDVQDPLSNFRSSPPPRLSSTQHRWRVADAPLCKWLIPKDKDTRIMYISLVHIFQSAAWCLGVEAKTIGKYE